MSQPQKKRRRSRKVRPVPTAEELAVQDIAPDRLRHNPVQSFVYEVRFVDDGKGNYSQERVTEQVAAKLHTLPNCLLFLSGAEYQAVCAYHTLTEGARPAMTGGYTPKVDGGGASNDPYDDNALDSWGDVRKACGGKGLYLIEQAFERGDILYSVDQKELIEITACKMALHMGLKN